MPASPDDKTYCTGSYILISPNHDFDDPVTNEPYVYRRKSDSDFEICAQFATDEAGNDGRLSNVYLQRENGNIWCLSGDNGYRSGS